MGFYKNTNGVLTPIAGGVSYSYAPIGSYLAMKDNSVKPQGYLLSDGRDTTGTDDELSTKYPLLYAYLGNTNILPTELDHSVLGVPEDISTNLNHTTNSNYYTAPYDGVIIINWTPSDRYKSVYWSDDGTNWTEFVYNLDTSTYQTTPVPVKKGDRLYLRDNLANNVIYARFYKQYKYIKAKDVNLSGGTQTLADRVEALETLTSDVIPSEASANNQLATENDIPDISGKQDKTLETPLTIGGTSQTTVEGALSALNSKAREKISTTRCMVPMRDFKIKTWTGLTSFSGRNVWTDSDNIYYSDGSNQYVLDKSTSTWTPKTWTGLTSFSKENIWTDGSNIYYSYYSIQYVLDKSTSTWTPKTWTGQINLIGDGVWTDGDNIYFSGGSNQYVLDKSTSTWTTKTWKGLTSFIGAYVWTDSDNIYCSGGSNQYVLDKSTSTWTTKTWKGLTSFIGDRIWTDGDNIYCSNYLSHYVLDKSTSTWTTKTWTGLPNFRGDYIWTDGDSIYYSIDSNQYTLNKYLTKM